MPLSCTSCLGRFALLPVLPFGLLPFLDTYGWFNDSVQAIGLYIDFLFLLSFVLRLWMMIMFADFCP